MQFYSAPVQCSMTSTKRVHYGYLIPQIEISSFDYCRTGSSAVETALTTLAIVYQRSRTFDEQSRKCNFLEIAEELADLLKVTKRWDRLDEDGNSDTIVSNIDVAYSDCANRPNQVELSTLPASLTIPGKTNRVIPKSPSASHNDRFLSFVSTVIALPSEVASEITTQDTESEETKDIHNQLSALKSTLKCEAALLAQELKTADKRKCVLQEINTELINEITILKQKEIEFQDKLEDRLKEKREKRQRGRKNRNEIRDARIPEESNFGENCDELEDDEEDSDNESSDDETHVNGTGESAKDHDKDLEGEGKNNKAVKILQNMFKDIHMFSSKSNLREV
ncbi:hypothetical protein BKA69DRAFT_777312 [Paraphysoderma sedebokerense]|nr:hypothetical protein BKA69DRAFT_777312 [Paraphysoderma sedebokerense]